MKKKLFSLLVVLALCVWLLPASPIVSAADETFYLEDGDIEIFGIENDFCRVRQGNVTYDVNRYDVVITQEYPDIETENSIIVLDANYPVSFTIENVSISASGKAAIEVSGAVDVVITFSGNNTLYSDDNPAIHVATGSLTLSGGNDDTLTATTDSEGAAIGSASQEELSGNIAITSGTVTATSGYWGAGIGTGSDSVLSGSINISGGTVTCSSTDGCFGAGIGTGYCSVLSGSINISGGTVTCSLTDRGYCAGIGTGYEGELSGSINILDGTVTGSSSRGAGIGTGYGGELSGSINILNGTVIGSSWRGAGIGTGYSSGAVLSGSINITGGTVTGTTADTGAWAGGGIGAGSFGVISGSINITGGTVEAASDNTGIGVGVNGTVSETAVYNLICGVVSDGVTITASMSESDLAAVISSSSTTNTTVSHFSDEEGVVTNPTCTANGYTTYTCTVCKEIYTADEIEATGHTSGEAVKENEVAATCTEAGFYDSVVYCTVCGAELSRETITVPATGHSYGEPVWSWATDYSTATATFTCGTCNHTEQVKVDSSSKTTAATCTEDGKIVYTATVTFEGVSYSTKETVTLSAIGHTPGEAVKENEIAATCTEAGSYDSVVYCTVCGAELSRETITIPATGHSYGEPVWSWASGYSTATATFTCGTCNHTEQVTVDSSSKTTAATCTVDGKIVYTATVTFEGVSYSTEETIVLSATGHTSGEAVKENEIAATCTEAGSYDSVVYCTVCGAELSRETVTVPATGHSYESVVTEPTCTAGGYTTHTCEICGDTYIDSKTEATGHTHGEAVKENEAAATCTTDGSYDSVVYCTVCGEELSRGTITIPATGHSWGETVYTWSEDGKTCTATRTCKTDETHVEKATATVTGEETKAATCTEKGETTYTAVFSASWADKQTKVVEDIAATGHTSGGAVKENEAAATCTKDGSYDSVVYCTVCGAELSRETITVPATGHTPGEAVKENETALTCTEDGSYDSVVYCTECGAELSRETVTISATGHSYESVVTEPTCTTGGYTTHTCTVCGDSYIDSETEVLGHSWDDGVVTTEATCTTDGVKTYTCTACGETKTEAIAATGHTSGETVKENEVAATCTEDGSYDSVVYCTVCGAELSRETVTVPATGHSYESVVTEPTCTTGGYTTHTCTICGDSYIDSETAATGHSWDDGIVTTEPTCTEDGVKTFTCTVCGATKTEAIAATGHSLVHVDAKEATCTEAGNMEYWYCETCGKYFSDAEGITEISQADTVISATVHTSGEAVKENEVAATCTEDGSYDSVVYCTECGAELSRETITVPATGHNYESVVTEPTCTEGGYTTHTCTVCSDSYVDSETEATGHNWDEGIVTTEATETTDGVRTYTCTECGETYTEVIEASGSTETGNSEETDNTATETSADGETESTATDTTATENTSDTDDTSLRTGDDSKWLLWTVLLIFSGAGIISIEAYGKRKRAVG